MEEELLIQTVMLVTALMDGQELLAMSVRVIIPIVHMELSTQVLATAVVPPELDGLAPLVTLAHGMLVTATTTELLPPIAIALALTHGSALLAVSAQETPPIAAEEEPSITIAPPALAPEDGEAINALLAVELVSMEP